MPPARRRTPYLASLVAVLFVLVGAPLAVDDPLYRDGWLAGVLVASAAYLLADAVL